MTIFELIREEVTAKQAGELYGMKFDKSGRGFCPWHNDGQHAALKFFDDDGCCYCHACHAHGDAIDVTAQMLGLSKMDAAKRIKADFHLDKPVDQRPNPSTNARRLRRELAREALNRRWSMLCDVVHEADARLAKYTPETADSEFWLILSARCKANTELDLLWEDIKRERTGRLHTKRIRHERNREIG